VVGEKSERWELRASLLEQAWIWSVIGYSVFRFVVAWAAFGDHGANAWVFGVIDVATAWPYAKAVAVVCKCCARAEWRRLGPAALVAIVTFLAPYAYLWIAAPSVPTQIRNGLMLFIVVMALSVAGGLVRRVRALKKADADASGAVEMIDLRALNDNKTESASASTEPASTLRLAIGRFDDPDIIPARIMQAEVYEALGFVHHTQRCDDFGALIDDWSRQSIHFALYDGDTAVGHARLIAPGPATIPVRRCFDLDIDVPGVWEWSAHVKAPTASRACNMELARHVVSFLDYNNIGQVALVCEPAMARLLERTSSAGQASTIITLCPDQYTWGAVVAPRLFDLARSAPRARAHFTSSHSAKIAASAVLPEHLHAQT